MTTRTLVLLIVQAVARHFGVTADEIRGRRRHQGIVRARWVGLWLAREVTGLSYPQIGQAFGGLDHTTVLHACQRMRERLVSDPKLRDAVTAIREHMTVNIPDLSSVAQGLMPTRPFHVLRICHSGETTIAAVRCGEVIQASNHNAAADIWVAEQERHSAFGEGDHFDLVVMDEAGHHIVMDVTTQVKAVLKLSKVQALS